MILSAGIATYALLAVEIDATDISISKLLNRFSTDEAFDQTDGAGRVIHVQTVLLLWSIVVAGIVLFFTFRTTASAEYLFIVLFLVSISFETSRLIWKYVIHFENPLRIASIVTRSAYFGRFCGILFLFCSGLFPNGIEYQKITIIAGVSCLVSFVLAYILAIDSTESHGSLFRIGGFREVVAAWFLIDLLAILNYCITAYRNNNVHYLFVALGILLLVTGRDIIVLTGSPLLYGAGIVILTAGIFVTSKYIRKIYLWI